MFQLVLILTAVLSVAATPIPPRVNGFVYQRTKCTDADPTRFDVFVDLMCPDCRQAYPTLKQVAEYYGDKIQMRLHTFPLPYHRNSMIANQGGTAFGAGKESDFFLWTEAVFADQELFGNAATSNMTETQVIAAFAALAQRKLGKDPAAVAKQLADTSEFNYATRTSWKMACSMGVTGTPTFFVNGVSVAGSPTWSVDDWKQVLDPTMPSPHHSPIFSKLMDCPSGTTQCTYLPGKVECCTPGENCIPNVGCRC